MSKILHAAKISNKYGILAVLAACWSAGGFGMTPDEAVNKCEVGLSKFVIGGINSSETIRSLKSINGISVVHLEETMRPGFDDGSFSGSDLGFLGKTESLLEVMAIDNETVLRAGLTHQKIADAIETVTKNSGAGINFNGRTYTVKVDLFMGSQHSPFLDKTGASHDYVIIDENSKKGIRLSGLLPILIRKYGFYEGMQVATDKQRKDIEDYISLFRGDEKKGLEAYQSDHQFSDPINDHHSVISYRVSPEELIKFFNLEKK